MTSDRWTARCRARRLSFPTLALASAVVVAGCASDVPLAPGADVPADRLEIGPEADSALLVVANRGTVPMWWEAASSSPLVTVQPTGSLLMAGDSVVAVVHVDKGPLPVGLATFQVDVRTGGFRDFVVALAVTVPPAPVAVVVPPDTVPFPYQSGGFAIRNTGKGTLQWAVDSPPSWLTLSETWSWSVGEGGSANLWFVVDRRHLPRDTTIVVRFETNAVAGPFEVGIPVAGNPPPLVLAGGARDAVLLEHQAVAVGQTVLFYDSDGQVRSQVQVERPPRRVVYRGPRYDEIDTAVLHDDAVSLLNLNDPSEVRLVPLEFRPRAGLVSGSHLYLVPDTAGSVTLYQLSLDGGAVAPMTGDVPPVKEMLAWYSGPIYVSTGTAVAGIWMQWHGLVMAYDPVPMAFHEGDGRFWIAWSLITSGGHTASLAHGGLDPRGPLRVSGGKDLGAIRAVRASGSTADPRTILIGRTSPGENGPDAPEVFAIVGGDDAVPTPPPPLVLDGVITPSEPVGLWAVPSIGDNRGVYLVVRVTEGPMADALVLVRYWLP